MNKVKAKVTYKNKLKCDFLFEGDYKSLILLGLSFMYPDKLLEIIKAIPIESLINFLLL